MLPQTVSPKFRNAFLFVIVLKIFLMVAFSSAFENDLFAPFVKHFLQNADNPWNYYVQHGAVGDEFPYNPLMLYILSVFYWPVVVFGIKSFALQNLFFKLPLLVADIYVAYLLLRMFPEKPKQVLLVYFVNPVVVYATYMHSQLDLIPTALLFAAVFHLRQARWLVSAVFLGLAISTKSHVIAAYPLIAIYMVKNRQSSQVAAYTAIALGIYALLASPFILTEGFQKMVLSNPRQTRILQSINIGGLSLYLPLLATFLAYGRFMMYRKINTELLDAFLALVFSIFVLLILPSPGWYVWAIPFLSVFLIKYSASSPQIVLPYAWLNACYLLYFVFFHRSDHADLIFGNRSIGSALADPIASNVMFTALEAGLLGTIYMCYRIGVLSNEIYRNSNAMVLGIGGDSGSGKTTLLGDLRSLLGRKIVEIEGDADHKWERGDEHWQDVTHLDPKSNYLHRQIETIVNLKSGKSVLRAEYNHETGKFAGPKTVHPSDFVVLLGLHTFYLPKLRKLIDIKIYLDPDVRVKTHWKILRDVHERGYNREEVLKQIVAREKDLQKFVAPQREFADIVIQYSCREDFEPGTPKEMYDPSLEVTVRLDSSIHLERLIELMQSHQAQYEWDYAEDLQTQYVSLCRPVDAETIRQWAKELIPNVEELVLSNGWLPGCRGFVQLTVLLVIADALRENEGSQTGG